LASALAGVVSVGSGCAPKKTDATADAPPPTPTMNLFPPDAQAHQMDAVPEVPYLIQLNVYRIMVPAGTISRSDEFWKHIDEHAVDVATYDQLYKNGVRVGVAPASEWDYLKDILEQNPAKTQPGAFSGREAKAIDLDMKLRVPYQDLFYFDTSGDLVGRSFERCDDLLRVSFQPAPRKPGTVRLGLCPVIRSLRERIVAVGDVNTRPLQFVHPEQLFELNLSTDVPLDSFLVVAPSPEAKWPTSLGNNFFVTNGAAEQIESIMIFRPITYREKFDPKNLATTQPGGLP
jgi:hypothetical protein